MIGYQGSRAWNRELEERKAAHDTTAPASDAYAAKLLTATNLAAGHKADVLAMAWRLASEFEGHYMNRGHLKP